MRKVSLDYRAVLFRGLRGLMLLFTITVIGGSTVSAQSLNWEGQTGVFVTPLAYSVPSKEKD